MRTRLLLLLLASAACSFGQYSYDYTGIPAWTGSWTANGAVDYDYSSGIDFGADSGSFIYATGVSTESSTGVVTAGNSNDYEVSVTFCCYLYYGNLVEYLRASSDALQTSYGSAGSFISVAVNQYGSLVVSQCVSGTVTTLGSTTLPWIAPGNNVLRSVIFGTTLQVFLNNQLVYTNTSLAATTGQPGVGGYGGPSGSAYDILSVSIGHHDVIAPNAPSSTGFRSSILPTSVSLAWQGVADDSIGIGFYRYNVSRNGTPLTYIVGAPLLTDSTVSPSTSYTYAVSAMDFHGNVSATTTISVTTPAASAVDPRRTGLYTTGSYWGGGGEQIDTLSGNLNFSIPLVKPMGRTGWTVPIGLSYNSQNWRSDGGYNWSLGVDNGYGYGWSLQIGSITPYFAGWASGVDHYVYTDRSGAQYRLDQNNGGIWSSLQGVYVWFDANWNQLHFADGKFWVMGCTSSGGEQDAGTMYPTILEDANGNQIIVTYQAAVGLPSAITNTSARITRVEDVRAVGDPLHSYSYLTYSFSYNTDPIPHLTAISNLIQTGETFPTFTYAKNVALAPPFNPSDPNYSGVTTTHLTNIVVPAAGPTGSSYPAAGQYTFAYDSAGAAELNQVTFPYGGHLRWSYATANYAGGRELREVQNRYLAADSAGAVEWGPYPFTHSDSGGTIATVHADTTLADASGAGAKRWNFNTSGSAWQIGLTAQFLQMSSASGGTTMTQDTYTWSQTSGSTALPKIGAQPYISQKTHVLDPGGSNSQSALSTQTLDAYGNLLKWSPGVRQTVKTLLTVR